jgi:hypothetical protein
MPTFAIVVHYANAVPISFNLEDAQDEAAAQAVKRRLDHDIKAEQAKHATVLVNIYEDFVRGTLKLPLSGLVSTELRVSD